MLDLHEFWVMGHIVYQVSESLSVIWKMGRETHAAPSELVD